MIENAKHTPGPWELWRGSKYVGGGEDICIGAGDTWLANMDHRRSRCEGVYDVTDTNTDDWDHDNCPICTIDAPEISAEQLANARLIAAAPDLLEALQALVKTIDPEVGHPDLESFFVEPVARAREVIAKAEGTD